MSTPAVGIGMLYVGSGSNNIMWDVADDTFWGRPQGDHEYAFRTTDGHLMWSFHVPGEAMPSAAYESGLVTFATGDGRAYGLSARSGAKRWATPLGGVSTMASATLDGDAAFFVVSLGTAWRHKPGQNHVVAVSLRDGRKLWSAPFGNSDCSVTVADGLVFVEGVQDARGALEARAGNNVVVALDEKTGKLRWQYTSDAGFFSDVGSSERAIAGMYNDGTFYQALPASGEFAAFDARTGKLRWKIATAGPVKMSAVSYKGKIYFGDTTGNLYIVTASSGRVSKVLSYNKIFTTAPPLIVGKTLFIANDSIVRAIPLSEL
jgi:outer membrane protein assembly factor BamB